MRPNCKKKPSSLKPSPISPWFLSSAYWYCVAQEGSEIQMFSERRYTWFFTLISVRLGGIIAQIQQTQHKNTEARDDNAKGTASWTYGHIKIEVSSQLRPLHSLSYLLSLILAVSTVSRYNQQHPYCSTSQFRKTDIGEVIAMRLQCSNVMSGMTFALWCPLKLSGCIWEWEHVQDNVLKKGQQVCKR